jgi:arylformamidase
MVGGYTNRRNYSFKTFNKPIPMKIIDISRPIDTKLPIWTGTPPYSLSKSSSIAEGKRTNDSVIYMGVHTGTHIDAPNHCINGTGNMQDINLADCIGEAAVIEFTNCKKITADMLQKAPKELIKERILLKTDNSALWQTKGNEFYQDFTAITSDAAQWLADKNIRLVGIDYLSIQLFADATMDTHLILLGKKIVILEGLDLSKVSQGIYQLFCLPLNITNSEAAPARVVLIEN